MTAPVNDGAPPNRWATLADLAAVEARLTDQLVEIKSAAWRLAGVILSGTLAIVAIVEVLKTN